MKTRRHKNQGKNRKSKKLRNDGGGLMDYFFPKTAVFQGKNFDHYTIQYNGVNLKCDVCGDFRFAHLDTSVNASKTGEMLLGDSTVFDHPLTIYRCKTCNYCKVIYRLFGIKNEDRPIKETLHTEGPPAAPVQPQPPAQPAAQVPAQAQAPAPAPVPAPAPAQV